MKRQAKQLLNALLLILLVGMGPLLGFWTTPLMLPVAQGELTGKYRGGTPRDSRGGRDHMAWFIEPYLDARSNAVVDAVARAADGLRLTTAQVALLWVRDAPGVTAPLLGARTVQQLSSLLSVDDQTLPKPIVAALDDVTGGPHLGRE